MLVKMKKERNRDYMYTWAGVLRRLLMVWGYPDC